MFFCKEAGRQNPESFRKTKREEQYRMGCKKWHIIRTQNSLQEMDNEPEGQQA